ncbi:hypothetical protein FHT26_004593 [Rhizobacter sp. SG703]|nr:hypothetical protein [Rhizobacter sp. SG703]
MKLAMVQALACFDTPAQVVDHIKQEFGVVITRQRASAYDPTKVSGKKLSAKLKAVFHASREAFLTQTSDIPIAHRSYRLRVLQRELERAEARGNVAMVLQLLEQAAKEVGGMFTNRREVSGPGGGPVQSVQLTVPIDPIEAAAAYQKLMQELDVASRTVRELY